MTLDVRAAPTRNPRTALAATADSRPTPRDLSGPPDDEDSRFARLYGAGPGLVSSGSLAHSAAASHQVRRPAAALTT
jgi:hypothetical protein